MECNEPNCNCKQPKSKPRDMTRVWLQKKIDRLWEMAGQARVDGDQADELRYTNEARKLSLDS